VKKGKKEQRAMGDDTLRRPTAMDLLKRLWESYDNKQPPEELDPLEAKTDIYSVPATRRRISQHPRPLK
jgi:hypothetical protein